MYQDIMDPSRIVDIVERGENEHTCKVYFNNGSRGLLYAGKAAVPANLFHVSEQDPQSMRIGFRSWKPMTRDGQELG